MALSTQGALTSQKIWLNLEIKRSIHHREIWFDITIVSGLLTPIHYLAKQRQYMYTYCSRPKLQPWSRFQVGKHTFVVVGRHHSQILLTMAILRDVVMYFIPTPGRGRMICPWNRWFLIDDVCFKKKQIFFSRPKMFQCHIQSIQWRTCWRRAWCLQVSCNGLSIGTSPSNHISPATFLLTQRVTKASWVGNHRGWHALGLG